jgi:pimeloyl-ACP methyl ester carboxylesterase
MRKMSLAEPAACCRGADEEHDADEHDLSATEDVSEPADGDHRRHERKEIGVHRPQQGGRRRVEVLPDLRKRHRDAEEVDGQQDHHARHQGNDPPLAVLRGDHRHGGAAYDARMAAAGDQVGAWERQGEHRRVLEHRIFVVDRGPTDPTDPAREPILVLHGFPTSSHDWHRGLDALSRRHRVVLLDMPGYGLSDKPDQRYSLFEQADLVEAVARDLGLGEVALVTHDMGDSVGGEILARSLDGTLSFGVARRVISNGSIYLEMAHLTDGQQLLLSLPDERLVDGLGRDALVQALRATFAPASAVPDEDVETAADLVLRDGGDLLLPRTIRYVEERREHEGRWTGAIERHPSPLTILWGDADPIAVWPMAERLHEARPDATLVRLRGVGHYPMLEAPEELTAALEHALA